MSRGLVLTIAALVVGLLGGAAPAAAIVNGTPARPADFPWLAQIGRGCTGTLVAPDRVLTAGHCVTGRPPSTLGTITFGGSKADRRAASVASAPGWVQQSLEILPGQTVATARHDAAVITLDSPVTDIAPIRLLADAERRGIRAGARVTVAGRGRPTATATRPSRILRRATLALLSDARCGAHWRRTGDPRYASAFEPSTMVCAGDPDRPRGRGARSVCTGDSGGPALVRTRSGAVRQAGVVSWQGDHCDEGPVVFTEHGLLRRLLDAPPAAAPVAPAAQATLAGEARPGAQLTCVPPAFASGPVERFTYQWLRFSFARGGERFLQESASPAYTVRAEDAGARLRCRPRAITAGGWAYAVFGEVRVASAE